ncbi:MAG: hypothetical protein K2X01_05185 [Cyanobacteria bacterium]|nr:hypothetical protein [Cyanobacteriota bacterium]
MNGIRFSALSLSQLVPGAVFTYSDKGSAPEAGRIETAGDRLAVVRSLVSQPSVFSNRVLQRVRVDVYKPGETQVDVGTLRRVNKEMKITIPFDVKEGLVDPVNEKLHGGLWQLEAPKAGQSGLPAVVNSESGQRIDLIS